MLAGHAENTQGALLFIERSGSLDTVDAKVAAHVIPHSLVLGIRDFVSGKLTELRLDINRTHGVSSEEHVDFAFLGFGVLVDDELLTLLFSLHDHEERPNVLGVNCRLLLAQSENIAGR